MICEHRNQWSVPTTEALWEYIYEEIALLQKQRENLDHPLGRCRFFIEQHNTND